MALSGLLSDHDDTLMWMKLPNKRGKCVKGFQVCGRAEVEEKNLYLLFKCEGFTFVLLDLSNAFDTDLKSAKER